MPRRRDRHGRGIRGPLALPNAYGAWVAEPPRPARRTEFFAAAVEESLARVSRHCPGALDRVTLGVEDVPYLQTAWSGDEVPLSAAVEPTEDEPGQVVVYRRPLEHRAANREDLRALVHRTIVEQLAALTNRDVEELDPRIDDDLD